MRRRALLAAGLVWGALLSAPVGAAPPLTCTSCDRPDLVDQSGQFSAGAGAIEFTAAQPYTGYGVTEALIDLDETHAPFATGRRLMTVDRMDGNRLIVQVLFWEIFEPDKLQRSSSKMSISQKDRVAIGLYHYSLDSGNSYNFTYTASSIEGCGGSASDDTSKNKAQWKVQCGTLGALLDALGVSTTGPARFFLPLLLDVEESKKLKLGGKAEAV